MKKYPIGPEHCTLYEEVGIGVSASVHRALCVPLNEIVAVKILDFERHNSDLVFHLSSFLSLFSNNIFCNMHASRDARTLLLFPVNYICHAMLLHLSRQI